MAYIDADFYLNTYGGCACDGLDALLERASAEVDILAHGNISAVGFDNLDAAAKEHVRMAAAAEADYIVRNGGSAFDEAQAVQMTLGKFSCRTSYSSEKAARRNAPKAVTAYLEAAGLLYRGIGL